MSLLITVLYIVFVLSAIVLITVVLLQEGKGGGLGSALGDSGQQTVGVGAKGINTFTGYVAGTFVVSALVLNMLNRGEGEASLLDSGDWENSFQQTTLSPGETGTGAGAGPGGPAGPAGAGGGPLGGGAPPGNDG